MVYVFVRFRLQRNKVGTTFVQRTKNAQKRIEAPNTNLVQKKICERDAFGGGGGGCLTTIIGRNGESCCLAVAEIVLFSANFPKVLQLNFLSSSVIHREKFN